MLEALLNASPGTQKVPGDDPLAAMAETVSDNFVPPQTPDAVEGSAGAVSFVPPMPTENLQNGENLQHSENPGIPENPLSSIPGIVLENPDSPTVSVPPPPKPPKKKEPMRPMDFLKIVGALFVVSLIFFGSFFAYIVFNPEEARLFVQFGINRADIQNLLALLVNSTFGTITFALSVVWAIYLFKAVITKKEYKRKKTVATILATFFGIVLFSNITFWAFLIQKIGAEDFANPNGGVKVFDNDRLLSEQFKDSSEIFEFNNLIGPAVLKFDLAADANYVRKKYMEIDSFEIDFDGDGTIDKEGANPAAALDLIFTYAKKGKYAPKGTYQGRDNITGEPVVRKIDLPIVNVSAVVTVTKTAKGIVFDAKDASQLGSPKWYESSNLNVPAGTSAVYTAKLAKEERFLCLALVTNKNEEENCNKIFVIRPEGETPITADIKVERAVESDPFTYLFSLENVKVKTGGDVSTYRWVLDNGSVFCQKDECEYSFNEYGKQKFTVYLTDAAGNPAELEGEIDIRRPLSLRFGDGGVPLLRVLDGNDRNLLLNSYVRSLEAYRVEKVTVPSRLVFDANDVRVNNEGYVLDSVEWTFGKNGSKKSGLRVEYELVNDGRLEVAVKYLFVNSSLDIRSEVTERIVFEGKRKDLAANIVISSPDSTDENFYAPTTIKFDGSASRTSEGSISKFIYDFGLGKAPAEGDAIQTIRYDNPGEYVVSLTVVKDDGSKDTVTRKIVIKDIPKSLVINMSVSSGIAGSAIDFDVSGSKGQIESYSWDFGDGTAPSADANPTHTFEKSGRFNVTLQARYADATIRTAEKTVIVRPAPSDE